MSATLNGLAAALDPARIRDAGPADAVGGVVPRWVVEPESEAEVAAFLAMAARDRLAVVPRGSGSSLDRGAPPERCDVVLSTARLAGVEEYEPGDLVLTALAGTPLSSVDGATAPHRQRLALDPAPGRGRTLGGVVATDASGPLRARHGTARDLVIGARFVTGDGVATRAGGRVVKNVAGYDLARLLCGSEGALAVVTAVTVRLHPVPEAVGGVLVDGLSPGRAAEAVAAVREARVEPATVQALWPEGALLVVVEGTAASVASRVAAVGKAAGGSVLDASATAAALEAARQRPWRGGDGPVLAVGVPPSRAAALLEICLDHAEDAAVHPGVGSGHLRLPEGAGADAVTAARVALTRQGGHVHVVRGGGALGQGARTEWPAPAAALLRRVAGALDPAGVLSPGRLPVAT